VDLSDPFQGKWASRQVVLHRRAQEVQTLKLQEVASLLGDLDLSGDLHDALFRNPVPVVDGHMAVPEGPGLGVEINEAISSRAG